MLRQCRTRRKRTVQRGVQYSTGRHGAANLKSTGIRESHRIVKFYEYPLTKEKNKVELANTRLSFEEVQRTEQELS